MSENTVIVPELRFVEETHEYFLGSVKLPSVTQIFDRLGFISEFAKNEQAALRGAMAHKACRYLFERRLDWSTVGQIILPYVVSLDRWIEQTGFKADECEMMGYHKMFLYAGSWDVKGVHPKYGPLLADLKSGEPDRWHPWQTAAYSGIAGRGLRRGSIYLQRNGTTARFDAHNDSNDFNKFLAALTVCRMKEE